MVDPTASSPPSACPVDHTTREAWLDKARQQSPSAPADASSALTSIEGKTCDSSTINQSLPPPPPSRSYRTLFGLPNPLKPTPPSPPSSLGTTREISTIPRTTTVEASPLPSKTPPTPANNEQDTAPSASGNWIYPSEEMFFNAMKRKSYDPKTEDMRAIVPIHNAVNERAWREIREWEWWWGQAERCGGPRLTSFSGLATSLTPKARLNSLLGYATPFDRHDWVVDRCGTRIEYVIDFYAGRDEGKRGKSLNFYLDVRPKLNTWEGWKMRVARGVGLS